MGFVHFPIHTTVAPISQRLRQQRERVGNLWPIPTTTHGERKISTNLPDALRRAKFVFVRRDARKSPLQTPYDGPYEVVSRSPKYFVLQLGNQQDTVSIDWLKPAYLDQSIPNQVAQPPRRGGPPKQPPFKPEPKQIRFNQPSYADIVTRSGRVSRPPQRYQEWSTWLGEQCVDLDIDRI